MKRNTQYPFIYDINLFSLTLNVNIVNINLQQICYTNLKKEITKILLVI